MSKQTVCNKCEEYCVIDINTEDDIIEIIGNKCNEGKEFIDNGIDSNKEIYTSLVRIKNSEERVVSVKSSQPIDKALFIKCSKALSRINVGAPIRIGDVVCKNLLNLGVDILCTKNINRNY